MKKALVVLLAALMIVSFTLPTFAVDFVDSQVGKKVIDPGNDDDVKIIPIDDENLDEEVKEKIKDAIEEIDDASDVTKLNENIKEIIDKYYPDYNVNDFVVNDIFIIRIDDDADRDEDGNVGVNIQIQYDGDDDPIFIWRGSDDKWHTVDPENVIRVGEYYRIYVPESGIFATLVPSNPIKKGGTTDKGDKTSPQTGIEETTLGVIAVSAICLAGVAVMVVTKRKADND